MSTRREVKDAIRGRDWETVAEYTDRPADEPYLVEVQVACGSDGRWYLRTRDDCGTQSVDSCDATAYETREDAVEAATRWAYEHDEGADEEEGAS
jgi:hypothetical protein